MYWVDLDPKNIMEIPVYFELYVSVNHETNIVINTLINSFNINYPCFSTDMVY